MLSLIVVAKGMWSFTKTCLETLLSTIGDEKIELIYVDNGTPSGENSWKDISKWLADKPTESCEKIALSKMVRFSNAVNLSKAWNTGLELSTGDPILIINNDLIFHSAGWWNEFKSSLTEPEVGVVGLVGMSWRYTSFIQGSIFTFTRNTFEKIGYFDERYPFTCEDVDYCRRLKDVGLKIKSHEHLRSSIEHLEGATRNYYRGDLQHYLKLAYFSRIEFCMKWNVDDGSVDAVGISLND